MTKDNDDALELADQIDQFKDKRMNDSAGHLRRLVAENEAKDALLRQAAEAIKWRYTGSTAVELVAAINQHLEGEV